MTNLPSMVSRSPSVLPEAPVYVDRLSSLPNASSCRLSRWPAWSDRMYSMSNASSCMISRRIASHSGNRTPVDSRDGRPIVWRRIASHSGYRTLPSSLARDCDGRIGGEAKVTWPGDFIRGIGGEARVTWSGDFIGEIGVAVSGTEPTLLGLEINAASGEPNTLPAKGSTGVTLLLRAPTRTSESSYSTPSLGRCDSDIVPGSSGKPAGAGWRTSVRSQTLFAAACTRIEVIPACIGATRGANEGFREALAAPPSMAVMAFRPSALAGRLRLPCSKLVEHVRTETHRMPHTRLESNTATVTAMTRSRSCASSTSLALVRVMDTEDIDIDPRVTVRNEPAFKTTGSALIACAVVYSTDTSTAELNVTVATIDPDFNVVPMMSEATSTPLDLATIASRSPSRNAVSPAAESSPSEPVMNTTICGLTVVPGGAGDGANDANDGDAVGQQSPSHWWQ